MFVQTARLLMYECVCLYEWLWVCVSACVGVIDRIMRNVRQFVEITEKSVVSASSYSDEWLFYDSKMWYDITKREKTLCSI